MCDPAWLPTLYYLNDYDGDWDNFLNAVYAVFRRDFITSQPKFQGCWVRCIRNPVERNKEEGFWHCIQGNDANAVPEPPRMERIEWIRAMIENINDPNIDCWENQRGREPRWSIWFREEFLVVLVEKTRKRDGFRAFLLLTAYDTPREHTRRKLRNERDTALGRNV
ncbi:MAG: hypothetical protein P9L92_01640 [Candidatus Electryonea clarkiae]|nr:hypothetical protein [Candidatus Electryonea clarkiae]MDP8289024.1 hypothetical protein [Candidatus Electryonea clarkiae]